MIIIRVSEEVDVSDEKAIAVIERALYDVERTRLMKGLSRFSNVTRGRICMSCAIEL